MMSFYSEPFAVRFYDEILYFWVHSERKLLVLKHVVLLTETFGFAVTFRHLAFCVLAWSVSKEQPPRQVSRTSVLQSGAIEKREVPGRAALGPKRRN